MKLTRQNMGNIAIAAIALIVFAGFVLLATRGGSKNNDNLSAVAPTSTTRLATTTTSEPEETTTSLVLEDTTTTAAAPAVTATTAQTRTTTTSKPTGTKKSTTTTAPFACPARGSQSTETTDNTTTFTHNQDGSVTEQSSNPGSGGSILFTIHAQRPDPQGDPSNVLFVIVIENKTTNHCVYFPNDTANFTVTLAPTSGGQSSSFVVTAGTQSPLQPGEQLKLTSKNPSPYGTFTASAAADVNFS